MSQGPDNIDIEHLEQAIARLRPLEREVVILAAREGLRNEEIAERMGISPRRTERLLAKVLRKLDRAFERQARPWWQLW